MVQRIGGFRRKTRHKLSKSIREKGEVSITRCLQIFNKGDKVNLSVEPAVQKGMFFPRFVGKCGTIKGKKGRCYEVLVKDQNKEKLLIINPVHLTKRA